MRATWITLPLLALAACSAGARDGEPAAARTEAGGRVYEVGAFDRVALGGPHDVIVTVGGAPSVRAEGDAEALDDLEVRIDGGTVEIGTRDRGGMQLGRGDRGKATVYVTVPALKAANVAGSGTLRVDRVQGETFDGAIAGSGDLTIDDLRVRQAEFSIAGSGAMRAAGTAEETKVGIAGSGDLDLAGLESRRARVNVMGSGDVRMRATETADVTIMGSGDVEIAGGARCSVSRNGGGEVRCGG